MFHEWGVGKSYDQISSMEATAGFTAGYRNLGVEVAGSVDFKKLRQRRFPFKAGQVGMVISTSHGWISINEGGSVNLNGFISDFLEYINE